MTENLEQTSQVTALPPASEPATFVVPEEYKSKGWVEKVKSPDDLWKLTDNAQSLLGKRPAGIPANDAPDADWEAFYKAARPESADKYTLSDIEGLPEGTDLSASKVKAQAMMYEAGLTPKQADQLWKLYVPSELETIKEKQTGLDKRYDETLTKAFGDKREASEKIAQNVINEYVPDDLKASVQALANNPEAMVGMIALANNVNAAMEKIRAEYGAEGKLPNGGEQVAATDINEVVAKQAKLRVQLTKMDFTQPEYRKAEEEIKQLGLIVARHYNK